MIREQDDKRWAAGKRQFWQEVSSELRKQAPGKNPYVQVDRLRKLVESRTHQQSGHDPQLIYHRSPAEVAAALAAGGYANVGKAPPGDVVGYLEEHCLRVLIVESDEVK